MPTILPAAEYFAAIPDPRVERTRKHALTDILVITLAATVAGAESFEAVAAFGRAKRAWLARFLPPANGIPSADTFGRVFARLDPQAFGACVGEWMGAVCEAAGLRHIAIDGKAVRSAPKNTFSGCLHLVSVWAAENRLILGQQSVADGSHEITAIPALLQVLELRGPLITIDAAGCQKEIARQVRDRGGDYLPAVRGNQPTLHDAVHAVFDRACEADFAGVEHDEAEAVEDGHGRHEERYVTVVYEPKGLPPEWPEVAAVVLIGREREVKGVRTDTAHYYVTSLRERRPNSGR